MIENKKKAVVLLSGGLDSSTTLAIANKKNFNCYALSINYGQKHNIELSAAKNIVQDLGAQEHKIVDINLSSLGGSALTDQNIDIPDYVDNNKIPITYVPARNTIFLGIALGWAEILDAQDIFIGACEIDYSGYPDCRREFINSFEKLANLATKAGVEGKPFKIHTPLISLSKAEIINTGHKLGVDYSLTISCYAANSDGHACGKCDSCNYRKKGFLEAKIDDPTVYYI